MAAAPRRLDVLVVGAGLSGLYLLWLLRRRGLAGEVVDRAPSVGGTWWWNRYPGLRCDVESMTFSYSWDPELEQEWSWPERYSTCAEILRYIRHVAERHDLMRDIRLETEVTAAAWDAAAEAWRVETSAGPVEARFLVMATGCLSVPNVVAFEGLDGFEGDWYHTAAWPEGGVDFTGRRVAVIGTGSSGIGAIPEIAAQAEHLTVFQRTANFSIPAWNAPISPEQEADRKDRYPETRALARTGATGDIWPLPPGRAEDLTPAEREAELERRWHQGSFSFLSAFSDMTSNPEANAIAVEFVHRKIREKVADPATAELLCPKDHPLGTKRLCVDHGYYETFNRPNVELVDIKDDPIERITEDGLIAKGREWPFDAIVLATGFDGMTGALMAVDIRGRDGRSLREEWADGPGSYLGFMVHGYPNLFTLTGPGSPSVLANMMTTIEHHAELCDQAIGHCADTGVAVMEPTAEAQADWDAEVQRAAYATLYPQAASWYMGANIPGKPRVFLPYIGGVGTYIEACDEVIADGWRGFACA
ncbi:MAG: flavin-containing monooxygenase [Gaiellales bacterium]